jgi:shikimate kinase
MATVMVLYGPKAAGKSWVAQALAERLGVQHVDVDALVLDLLAAGVQPDPADGWLAWVEQRVLAALDTHQLVSVEATGAWDSDWRLADDLEARGVRVLRVWVSAPKQLALRRLAERTARRVPVSAQEASWIYDQATVQATGRRLDARIDTGEQQDRASVVAVLRPLLATSERLRGSCPPAQAHQRAGQPQPGSQDVGAPLVADLQAAAADQPPQGRLDHPPVAAQPLAGLDAAPGDPGVMPRRRRARRQVGWHRPCQRAAFRTPARPTRPAPRPDGRRDRIDQLLQQQRVMGVGRRQPHRQRNPSPIDSRWYLEPDLPWSTGLAPVSSPHAGGVTWRSGIAEVLAGCARLPRPGGLLVTVTKITRRSGRLNDLAATTVRLAEQAGFGYLQHVIALHAAVRMGALVAGRRSGSSPRPALRPPAWLRWWAARLRPATPGPHRLPVLRGWPGWPGRPSSGQALPGGRDPPRPHARARPG